MDTITLNPTEYLIFVLGWFSAGYLSSRLIEKMIDFLNKYFYIKGDK